MAGRRCKSALTVAPVLELARLSDLLLAAGSPDAPALVDGERTLSYGGLREAVERRSGELDLPDRSLVVHGISNTVDGIVTYLALVRSGHVPLLAGAHHDELAASWSADAVVRTDGDGWSIDRRRRITDRHLHPQLALLMSTSGSTGSPKLVRLSHDNLIANARAIVEYLGLTAADRGITSLPLHYCYGLSVLHSHLAAGAGVVLTAASVVDPCFAAAMRRGVTNVAGVPHTFDLLDRAGPERIAVPSLRLVTQAGGRMAPDRVRRWAHRTRSWGADLVVMYGQTEATARMAYLPPHLVDRHPGAVGHAVPGGELEIRPVPGVADAADGVGEVVYRGPNVMMGYATCTDDLAEGQLLDELATGDLGRIDPVDGVLEIVGRRSRLVKPFGLRIDLDELQSGLADVGVDDAVVAGDDERVVVCAPGTDEPDGLRRRVVERTGLPSGAVLVDPGEVPRTASGKVDHGALLRRATGPTSDTPGCETPTSETPTSEMRGGSVAEVFASLLGRRRVEPSDTFVSLGGDSLSYVECSVVLERRLGRLPDDWHHRTVAELDGLGARRSGRGTPRLDTTVLLRAAGILIVVSTHMHLWYFPGGAHLMLAVMGYNASRFLLGVDGVAERALATVRSVGRLAVPTVAFVGVCMALVGGYGWPTLTLTNGYLGPASHMNGRWHYWFIEVAVQVLLVLAVLLSVGVVRRFERRAPYGWALALLGVTLVLREVWITDNLRFQSHGVAWFFVLGLLVHRSRTVAQKIVTSLLCLATIPGFFDMPHREAVITGGLILLVWCRELPLPRVLIRPVAVVAASSLAIYLTHFRIWRVLDRNLGRSWAYVATIAAGIAIGLAFDRLCRAARARRGRAVATGADRMVTTGGDRVATA